MKLKDIPVGHLAISNSLGAIILVGKGVGMWLNGGCIFDHLDKHLFYDDYEDLGELKINISTKIIKNISFEAKL